MKTLDSTGTLLICFFFFFVLHTEMSRVLKTPIQDSPCSLTVSGSYLIFTLSVLGLIP